MSKQSTLVNHYSSLSTRFQAPWNVRCNRNGLNSFVRPDAWYSNTLYRQRISFLLNLKYKFLKFNFFDFNLFQYFPSGLNLIELTLRAKLNIWIIDLLLVLHKKHSTSSFANRISQPSGDTSTIKLTFSYFFGSVSALLLLNLNVVSKSN